MKLPHGATVAVADGARFVLFRNAGDEANPNLTALPTPEIDDNSDGGKRHRSSAADPDVRRQEEDAFAVGAADWLNHQALTHKIDKLVIIAAPRTLGELRRHYHKTLSAMIVGEIDKDLTGHTIPEIEKAIASA